MEEIEDFSQLCLPRLCLWGGLFFSAAPELEVARARLMHFATSLFSQVLRVRTQLSSATTLSLHMTASIAHSRHGEIA